MDTTVLEVEKWRDMNVTAASTGDILRVDKQKTTRWGYACHYLLDEGHRRGCEPGKDCSRRTVGKVKNESKRLVNEGAAP